MLEIEKIVLRWVRTVADPDDHLTYSYLCLQELHYKPGVMLTLLPEWCVARLLERDPLHLADPLEERRDDEVLRNVPSSVDDERRNAHHVKAFNNGPIV